MAERQDSTDGEPADDTYEIAPLPATFEQASSAAYRKSDAEGEAETYAVGEEVDSASFPIGATNWREAAAGVHRDSDAFSVGPELPRRRSFGRSLVIFEAARKRLEIDARRIGNVDDDRRYTLRGLFSVVTMTAVVLALGSRLPRPVFAFLMGAAALFTLFFARWMRRGSAILVLSWWTLLTIYLLVSAFAILGY